MLGYFMFVTLMLPKPSTEVLEGLRSRLSEAQTGEVSHEPLSGGAADHWIASAFCGLYAREKEGTCPYSGKLRKLHTVH